MESKELSKLFSVKALSSLALVSLISINGFAVSVQAADINSWQSDVSNAIAKKQVYPRAALRKEIEGKATVEINIDREGNIVAHSLKSSTGNELLDNEIAKLMERASPLPKPPANVSDKELTMVVPLAWTIQ